MFSKSFKKKINNANVTIHIPQASYEHLKSEIDPTIVHRTSKKGVPLMTATDVVDVIPPGGTLNIQALLNTPTLKASSFNQTYPREIFIKGKWYTAKEKCVNTAKNANTFGASGTFEVLDTPAVIEVPTLDARFIHPEALEYFGAKLIPIHSKIQKFNTSAYPLPLVVYSVSPSYVKEYLFNKEKGGGAFIERHTPPHLWAPLHPSCEGALILGKYHGKNKYSLIGLTIPFGYGIIIKENTLHSDSFLKGSYLMALSARDNEDVNASTVIFRKKTKMQTLSVTPSRFETKQSPYLNFQLFSELYKACLEQERQKNAQCQREYDQHFGLIPYKSKA